MAAVAAPASVELAYDTIDWAPAEGGQLTEALYEGYTLQSIRIAGAQVHPTTLVQSAAMASVAPPKPSYRPHLPKSVVTDGLLEDAGCARGPDSFTKGLRIGVAIDGENLRVFFCLPPQVDVIADKLGQIASIGSGH